MQHLFSCCTGGRKRLKTTSKYKNNGTLDSCQLPLELFEDSIMHAVPEVLADEYNGHMKSYHSEFSSPDNSFFEEDEESMRGVSNVVYSKE